jgi:hypothetical protein
MKRTIISLAVLASVGLSGCSVFKSEDPFSGKGNGPNMPQAWETPIKDTTLSVDFKDDGIKIYYTTLGKLEKIEVYGLAPVWKGNPTVLAEADASVKLVKFIHGKNVSSTETVKVIGKAIEKSQDGLKHDFNSKELQEDLTVSSDKSTSAQRNARYVNDTLTQTVTTITASGRLTGVRKTGDFLQDNGRMYVAVYEWNERDQAVADRLRKIMSR